MHSKFTIFNSNKILELGLSTKVKKTFFKKTITLSIKNDYILISVPHYFTDYAIHNLIADKMTWIKKKIIERKNYFKRKKINFLNGDKLYFFGSNICLKVILAKKTEIYFTNNFIKVFVARKNTNIKTVLEKWYKSKSFNYLEERATYFAKTMKLSLTSVTIRNFKRRLGSCSNKGDITFNWKIIMLPKEVIDYIVVHELSHLIHFNHSKNFWKTVKVFCPKFKQHKDWIKKNIQMLDW